MLADSSGSSASTSKNAFTHSTATSGASRLRLSASTFASFHSRAFRAIHGSHASAARTPGTLFAAIDVPVPVQHITTPKSSLTCRNGLPDVSSELWPAALVEDLDVLRALRKILDNSSRALILIVCAEVNSHLRSLPGSMSHYSYVT